MLTLAQNVNTGWQATLDGKELSTQRVDGWKQGWRVPAGASGTVRFDYAPQPAFQLLLYGGFGLLALVVVAALPLRWPYGRHLRWPALRAGRPGLLDLTVVLLVGGLLGGWWGVALVSAAVAAARVSALEKVWAPAAGLAMLFAGVGLTWPPIVDRSWALEWTQACGVVALACVSGALAAGRTRMARHRDGGHIELGDHSGGVETDQLEAAQAHSRGGGGRP